MVPEKTSARLIHFADRTTIYSLNEQWNAFLILYELRNFSLTAKRLGVTQSALSKAIKKLEDHLQITLFDRSQRPIRPTADAKALYEDIFDHVLKIEESIKQVRSQNYLKPTIHFGCTESTSRFVAPPVAQSFAGKVSKFVQVTASSEVLVEKLINRQLDVIFICEAFEEIGGLTRQFIFEEPSVLLLPAELAKQKSRWTLDDLLCCGLPMIASASGSGGARLNERMFSSFDIHFQSQYEVQSDSVLVEMIKMGLGWSITRPLSLTATSYDEHKLKVLPFDNLNNSLKYYVVCRKDEYKQEAQEIARICRGVYLEVIQKEFLKFAPWLKESQ